jgi:hypothetical protein
MSTVQPVGTDLLNSPSHSLLHRQIAADPSAPVKSIEVTATGEVLMPYTNTLPSGIICLWSGSIATIPSGWYLCNGSNGTPDLRDRFVVGANQDAAGVAKTNVTGSLTVSGDGSIPSHTHTVGSENAHTHSSGVPTGTPGSGATVVSTQTLQLAGYYTTGAGSAHDHTLTNSGTGTTNIAVYYALAYIMKS